MFVFSKVIDQLISPTLLKINSIIDLSRNLPRSKTSYLPNDPVTAVSVSLKTFVAPEGKKCFEYSSLGLTLKV